MLTLSHLAGLEPLEEYTGDAALGWTPVTEALSEGGGPQTVTVIAELDPGAAMANFYARVVDSVSLTVDVVGSGGSGVVGFEPVESFPLVIEIQGSWGWADFDLAPLADSEAEGNETVTVSAAGKGAIGSADLTLTANRPDADPGGPGAGQHHPALPRHDRHARRGREHGLRNGIRTSG